MNVRAINRRSEENAKPNTESDIQQKPDGQKLAEITNIGKKEENQDKANPLTSKGNDDTTYGQQEQRPQGMS